MEILNQLGIKTKNEELYEAAFTHTSYAYEHHTTSYERLEYLGDAVLELIMSEYLYKNSNKPEGEMTKLRSRYVCEEALNEYAIKLGLNKYLRLGNGEQEGRYKKTIVSDIFESFIGAMFLDQGIETVKKFIYKYIIPIIQNNTIDFFDDYKSALQELVQTDKRTLKYIVTNESGPAHNRQFTVEVRIGSIIYGVGTSHSKKAAEQEAAKDALKKAQIKE